MDLREKIVRAYDQGEGLQRTLARVFGVSHDFIRTLLKRRRETGRLAPKPAGGGRRPNLDAEACLQVRQLVTEDPDATLAELCKQVQQDCGQVTSPSAMCRLLQKLGVPRKKRLGMPPNATRPASSRRGPSLPPGRRASRWSG